MPSPREGQAELLTWQQAAWLWGCAEDAADTHPALETLQHVLSLACVTAGKGKSWGCCELRAQGPMMHKRARFLLFWDLSVTVFLPLIVS